MLVCSKNEKKNKFQNGSWIMQCQLLELINSLYITSSISLSTSKEWPEKLASWNSITQIWVIWVISSRGRVSGEFIAYNQNHHRRSRRRVLKLDTVCTCIIVSSHVDSLMILWHEKRVFSVYTNVCFFSSPEFLELVIFFLIIFFVHQKKVKISPM